MMPEVLLVIPFMFYLANANEWLIPIHKHLTFGSHICCQCKVVMLW